LSRSLLWASGVADHTQFLIIVLCTLTWALCHSGLDWAHHPESPKGVSTLDIQDVHLAPHSESYPLPLNGIYTESLKEGVCEFFPVDHMAHAVHVMVSVSKTLPDMQPRNQKLRTRSGVAALLFCIPYSCCLAAYKSFETTCRCISTLRQKHGQGLGFIVKTKKHIMFSKVKKNNSLLPPMSGQTSSSFLK
jgi:hypothetical protein